MKDSKRATVYFDPEVHKALSRKAAKSDQSISHVVNETVRMALAEDSLDLKVARLRLITSVCRLVRQSEAWRFFQGESPCGARINHPLLPRSGPLRSAAAQPQTLGRTTRILEACGNASKAHDILTNWNDSLRYKRMCLGRLW